MTKKTNIRNMIISTYITSDDKRYLMRVAKKRNTTISALIIEALDKTYFNKDEGGIENA